MSAASAENKAAPGVPYYTPAQEPQAGTASDPATAPTLFKPITTRGLSMPNRIVASPMCQYSADDGHLTDYHLVHLGQMAMRGAGLVFVEATAVEPRGRISPQDSGLWKDSQVAPLKRIVDFAHSQGAKVGIQLAHAGRKASTLAPWLAAAGRNSLASEEHGGWPDDVVAPSAIPYYAENKPPKELTVEEIKGLVKAFAEAARKSVEIGFDTIEIHGAHGYLITSFLSPLSNQRTDNYGGSYENRTRFLREIIAAVRAVIPSTMPLWLRISGTEWMEWTGEPSWDVESSIRLARELPSLGVDVLDVSSSGNNSQQKITASRTYQTDIARKIRKAIRAEGSGLLVGTVGFITDAQTAHDLVQEGDDAAADFVLAARQFLREPEWVLRVAHELKVTAKWPNQYHRAAPPSFDVDFTMKGAPLN